MKPQTVAGFWGSKRHLVFTIVIFVILASLDNTALALLPPLYPVVARDLSVSEASIGLVTAVSILTVAVFSVVWGYWGDRSRRKGLLFCGTLIWSGATLLTALSQDFAQLLASQALASIGLGCIASVGFSVISDFVPQGRQGLAMSMWGLSQGVGTGLGLLLGGAIGAHNWHLPFLLVGGIGVLFAALYLLAYDPQRGRNESELSALFTSGQEYNYRIKLADVPGIIRRGSNIWLILQGLTAQVAYGSLLWLPRLYTAKVEAAGYSLETATITGTLFAMVFQIGGVFSVLGGHIGDRWQRRDLRGRAFLSAICIVGAIPLLAALFFLPLTGLRLPESAGSGAFMGAVLNSMVINVSVATTFVLAFGALALTSVASPNWYALIRDVNLPEHRGTVFGLANLSDGIGRAVGNGLTGVVFSYATARFSSPLGYAIGLAALQVFLVPTGLCYYLASRTTPRDIAGIRKTLAERARTLVAPVVM